MNLLVKIGSPIAVIAVGIVAMAGLSAGKAEPQKKEIVVRPPAMHVSEARNMDARLEVLTQGEVRPRDEIELAPQVSGRIVMIADDFGEGGTVSPGQTLIKIDDSDYRLAVTRARGRIAEAEVRLEQEVADARIKTEQWKNWVTDGEPTPLALNKPQVAEAKAKLEAAKADLRDAELDLERTNIAVPFNGKVRMKSAGLGQLANAGQTLGTVYSTDLVEVRLPLTDEQISDLGLAVGYQTSYGNGPKVTFSADFGGEQREWTGYIVRTDAAVDPDTRLFFATAQVADPYGAGASEGVPLAVGLFVNAKITGREVNEAIALPRTALRGKDEVYVVTADNRMSIRKVDVVSTSADEVVVSGGVQAGEQVIVSPVRTALEGLEVEPITPQSHTAESETQSTRDIAGDAAGKVVS